MLAFEYPPAIVFDAPTIIALGGLLTVIVNLILAIEARWNIRHLTTVTNGQADKLNAVSKALGHAEGAGVPTNPGLDALRASVNADRARLHSDQF